jgi:pyruvate/2-oxoglutarate dehydrogenase complex dihydrolipoamide dehydrogenase (E3) component
MKADVIVIGSGQAGVPLATRLAAAGRTVIVAERKDLGGTCVNVGCTPTKTMIASARAAHVARTGARLGVGTGEVSVDLGKVVDRKDAIVGQWRAGVARRLKADRLTVVHGQARFTGPREVDVGGQAHTADVVIINTGARPVVPKLSGLDAVPYLTNATLLQLRELPSHLLILGGGYIGCEFGQMFRRFGARVTIADGAAHLMNREDPDISSALEDAFRGEGIALELGVSGSGGDVRLRLDGGRELRGSHLLVAVGRRPNTDDLGCDKAGVKLDDRGSVLADDQYRTSADGVYAVGDVLGFPQFTHTSWDDHRRLFDILLGRSQRGRSGRFVPYTAFTDPQVAGVGLTEKEAKEQKLPYEAATMPFGDIARAQEIDEKAGVMKLLIDPKTERILGARIVGAEAGELIHIFVALMQAGASPRAIADMEAVHPTFAEGVQSLVMKLDRFALK